MIDPSWLGRYQHGYDEEDGIHSVRFWIEDDRVRFSYHYECHTNHGFDKRSEMGTVIAVSDSEITVQLRSSSSSGWEDLFKEGHDDTSTTTRRTRSRSYASKTVVQCLQYQRAELAYKGS